VCSEYRLLVVLRTGAFDADQSDGSGFRNGHKIVAERAKNPKTLLDGPGPATREEKSIGSNTTNIGRGVDYLTARIARDRPDILNRMKAGEFSSVRQAAIAAGIVKVRTTPEWVWHRPGRCTPDEQLAIPLNPRCVLTVSAGKSDVRLIG
jgi:hypothetical protein